MLQVEHTGGILRKVDETADLLAGAQKNIPGWFPRDLKELDAEG